MSAELGVFDGDVGSAGSKPSPELGSTRHAMKASLKVRDGQKPLVKASVPVNFLGFPLFSGISLGDPEELGLHLGSCVESGPLLKATYKPNDLQTPFSVLLKTGVGVWGSPAGAALAMAAEFNLSGKMSPSFMLRVKPRVGDFSLVKDTGYWSAGVLRRDAKVAVEGSGSGMLEMEAWTEENKGQHGGETSEVDSSVDRVQGRSSIAVRRCEMGLVNGRSSYLENCLQSNEYPGAAPGGADGNGEFGQSTLDRARGFGSVVSHLEVNRGDLNGSKSADGSEVSEESCVMVNGFEEKGYGLEVSGIQREASLSVRRGETEVQGCKNSRKASYTSSICNAWCLRAHSLLPLGRHAVANIRWRVKVPSEMFQGSFTLAKLPMLVMDKISLESTDPVGKGVLDAKRSSRYPHDIVSDEKDEMLHQMTNMFSAIRHQLRHLHSENRAFKRALEDLKVEVGYRGGSFGTFRGPSSKPPADLLVQEENMLRSQLFDDIHGKINGNHSTLATESEGKLDFKGKKEKEHRNEIKAPNSAGPAFGSSGPTIGGRSSLSEPDVSEELKKAIRNATGAR